MDGSAESANLPVKTRKTTKSKKIPNKDKTKRQCLLGGVVDVAACS